MVYTFIFLIAAKESCGDLHLSEEQYRRSVAARFNWHVMYTLLHNPDIRVTRKGYLQMLHQARQLGVHVPVSDRQADVNFDQLQQNIAEAKERLNPSCKNKGQDACVVGEDDNLEDNDLNEVITVGSKGNESEQGDTSPQDTKMSNMEDGENGKKGEHSPRGSYTEQEEGRGNSSVLVDNSVRQQPCNPHHITSVKL